MPRSYTNYAKDNDKSKRLADALNDIIDNGVSIAQAARTYDIPRKTLSDKVSNKHLSTVGRPTGLTPELESLLVKYIQYMSSKAFPLSISLIRSFTFALASRSGLDKRFNIEEGPGKTWWNKFYKRHIDEIKLRTPDSVDRGRTAMARVPVIKRYFNTLEKVLIENDLMNQPDKIFNTDESGLNLELRKGKVVVAAKQKQAYSTQKGSRDHITVNCCISASAQNVPPFIIYSKSMPSGNYVAKGPHGALYGKSPNGYMDEHLFLKWFSRLFIPSTAHLGKRILIIDGHGSHITLDVIDLARQNDVILFCLPPHTTHVTQPLDVSMFGPLKTYFSKVTDQIQFSRLGVTESISICKTEFSAVFNIAYKNVFNMDKISSAFEACGIYPFNADRVISSKKLQPSTHTEPSFLSPPEQMPSLPSQPKEQPLTFNQQTNYHDTTDFVIEPAQTTQPSSSSSSIHSTLPGSATSALTSIVPSLPKPSTEQSPLPGPSTEPRLNTISPGEVFTPSLVEGLKTFVPENIREIFVTPFVNRDKKKKNTRVILKERIITSDEYREEIMKRNKEKEVAEQAKQKRKEKREADKARKEELAKKREGKRKQKEIQSRADNLIKELRKGIEISNQNEDPVTVNSNAIPPNETTLRCHRKRTKRTWLIDDYIDDENDCASCFEKKPPNVAGKKKVSWIQCDQCMLWYHKVCVDASPDDEQSTEYICPTCMNMFSKLL